MKAIALIVLAASTSAGAEPDATIGVAVERPVPAPRWKRMMLETAALIGVGEAYYYRGDGTASAHDWQLPGSPSAIGRKLTGDGIRFDSNGFVTNTVKHPILFGGLVHGLARDNGFSLAESFLISSAVSIGWEFVGEWREYASINDLLTTSTAGTPVGEAAYQIIHHLRQTRFELHTGLGRVSGVAFHTLGASAQLDTIPHREEIADNEGTISQGNKVRLALEVPFDRSTRAIEFSAKTSLVGYYRNHVDESRRGYNLFVGASAGYDYWQKMDRPEWQWDLLANVRVGPTVDLDLYSHGVTVRAGLDLTGDFAMVKSYAYGTWRAAHPMAIVQGVLQSNPHYYYYAAGLSLEPRLAVEYRGLSIGAALTSSAFSSLDDHDRDQAIVTTHIHVTDHAHAAEAWVGAQVGGVTVRLQGREQRRDGEIGMVRDASTERTVALTLGYGN